jgi:hypothetical protein
MTLLEIAEYLSVTQQTLYDKNGMCVLRNIGKYEKSQRALNNIHFWKGPFEDRFYIQKPDDNATFILLVNEVVNGKV